MDILRSIQTRRSIRKYGEQPVEQEKIERCLEAGRLAPSACNAQPWTFIVVNEPGLKDQVARTARAQTLNMNKFAAQAPAIIAIVEEPANVTSTLGSKIKRKHYPLIDIGIAAENICLQATEEGLGTCMIGWLNEKKAKRLLGVPDSKRIPLLISLGYTTDEWPNSRNRKAFEKIVRYNKY
ncbi:MAG: nitroreductase family protein [Bacteroidales bacterium]|nr:nitroreductase family protein [Bacteroidales bacterium]